MATDSAAKNMAECDEMAMRRCKKSLKTTMKEIREFNAAFVEFLDVQRKQARELCTLVTRYNILNSGPPLAQAPILVKSEILEELLVQIQEMTTRIHQALIEMEKRCKRLPEHRELCENQRDLLDWNVAFKGSATQHRSLSQSLEESADILFQFDIAITCIRMYFDALDLRECKSYQHLMNSFTLSKELTDLVNEFEINCTMTVH